MNTTLTLPGFDDRPVCSAFELARIFDALAGEDQEVICAAFLSASHHLISQKEIFRGTVSECPGQPREILREALKAGAVKLAMAHNHVSGDLRPSDEDLRFTMRMEWAAEVLGIPLLDHVIIGKGGRYFSFAEARLLGKCSARPWRRRSVRRRESPNRSC